MKIRELLTRDNLKIVGMLSLAIGMFMGCLALWTDIQEFGEIFSREETVTAIDLYQSGRLLSEDRTLLRFESGESMILDDHHPEIQVGSTYQIRYKAWPYDDVSKVPKSKACELYELTRLRG